MNKAVTTEIYEKIVTFLVPEKQISLKLIFDNIRNYGIIALIYLLSLWLRKESSIVSSGLISAIGLDGVRFAVVPKIVAGMLLALNMAQSVFLVSGLLRPLFDFAELVERFPPSELDGWARARRFVLSLMGLWVVIGILTLLVNFFLAVTLFAVVNGLK